MQTEPRIVFDDIPIDEAVRTAAVEHVAELEQFHDRITACTVVIALPHRRHERGSLYSVRIDLVVPGGQIVVNRDHHDNHAHEDVFVALRDAFDAARRRLEDHVRRMRGVEKIHASRAVGFVARLFPLRGYGFIETPDGREIYFHRHAVLNDRFDAIEPGWEVEFAEESGEQGPQAASVWVVHIGGRPKLHEPGLPAGEIRGPSPQEVTR
jgi:cold shock CspA family protein/ribosome-associated translation inhibitor RaiA